MQTLSRKPPTKIERVLAALLRGPATTRDLEHVGDHVAHSTAAELRARGVTIHAELIEVPGYAGTVARVARYTIQPEGRDYAERLLADMRSKRGYGQE